MGVHAYAASTSGVTMGWCRSALAAGARSTLPSHDHAGHRPTEVAPRGHQIVDRYVPALLELGGVHRGDQLPSRTERGSWPPPETLRFRVASARRARRRHHAALAGRLEVTVRPVSGVWQDVLGEHRLER